MHTRARCVPVTVDSFCTMPIHKPILGTRYSGTVFVTGALHVQLHMNVVICLIVDDVIIFLYGIQNST